MNRPSFRIWRPATTYILIGGLVVLLIALVASFAITTFRPTTEVKVGSGVYKLWVADSEAELVQGLSGVESLPKNGGLLMKFSTDDRWGIWMKDMKVPLDIVWLNKDKEIIYIVKNAQPSMSTNITFTPKEPARYVIELPLGSVENAGLKTGMIAAFDDNDDGGVW